MRKDTSISDILSPLRSRPTQAYISAALQVADIVDWILASSVESKESGSQIKKNQPVTVWQTTFSISEEFLRRTYFLKQRHPARFIVIIDRKALMKTRSLWPFIIQVYDEVYIADNHSKVLLVEAPDGFRVSMVTSQNLTRGNRAESAVISSDPGVFASLWEGYEDLKTNHSAPMHEIMTPPQTSLPAPVPQTSDSRQKIYADIERLAGCFIPITDIATVLGLDPMMLRDMIADQESPEHKAYAIGKAKARVAIRAQEMELAKIGSPLGMQSVRENLITMEEDEA